MAGSIPVQLIRNVYSVTSVTAAAWVELDSAVNENISEIEIFDSSGQTLKLGTGASGSEADLIYIMPGGNGKIECLISKGVRLSVRAVSGTASTGELTINLYTK